MSEIQVWENVLKWGLAQNPGLSSNPSNYSKDDFNSLKNTLQSCIPFIRFYNLTSQEFSDHILPYKEVLPEELYMDLLKTFLSLNPNSKPGHKSNPRMTKEITPPSPPKPSVSYFNEPPRLSSNPFEAFLNLNSLNPNSNPIHKSNPRMTKEITPPSPPKPSVSYFNEPPRLSSGPFEAFFNPSHKSDSSSPFKEIAPPPPLKPSYSYHKSNPHNAKKIAPPLPLKSSYSNPRNTKKIAPPPPLKSSYSNPRNTKKIAPPPPLKPSYSYSTNDLGIQSPSSSNYNGDLFDSSASIYQKTKMNPWKDVQKSLPVELDQEFSEEYQEKLIHLVNMGFDNEEENLKALKEFNGELDRVIENLLKM
ncbi:hypothetical protein RhiirA4_33485 [Rhizophagus irregularis]|uniref:UBA domain-containing protein n=1 Tax=Rhizophagus irregularis TaxID=588596 RepID=A0A2I1H284_9GLOM|nr:hypothetical protein RhiirA4_33485 [Rhizophagus irregularis]